FTPGSSELSGAQRADLDSLANDLAEAKTIRDQHGYQPPVVKVSGANAQAVADVLAGHGIDAQVRPGRAGGAGRPVNGGLRRRDGYAGPQAPVSARVPDTVIASPAAQGPPPILDDPAWRHSTAKSADWFDTRDPVPSKDITNARGATPVTGTVRGE